ncbi:MAG: anhydro-N-acetylmuramic acid kinase [Mariprofundaceae bacterium]|nr:anhydro-N-acetylmuramic acid kinase [Mariprofundaceae bacterium]
MEQPIYLMGIMSGTSADGIDVAIIEHSEERPKLIHFSEYPMPQKLREPILRLAEPGIDEIDALGALDRALGKAFADSANKSIEASGISSDSIIAIGSHGQTIRHRPKGVDGSDPFSLQIGCAATIAEMTGITTVSDFRRRDIAAGGEGAPLVPFVHRELYGNAHKPVAILNIGGIANITYIYNRDILGFDTGPGNMIMDAVMLSLTDGRNAYDENGELAATGNLDEALLTELLNHPYLKRRPPKSTGRETFGSEMVDIILTWPEMTDADRMATATEFTALAIKESCHFLPETPADWYLCGGGALNGHLARRLAELLAPASVNTTHAIDIPPEAMEAVCFALLARNTLAGESNTVPAVTGATHAVACGAITPGHNWPTVIQQIEQWIRSPTV